MVNLSKKLIGATLGGKGQIGLLILLLAAAATARFTLFGSPGLSLDKLGFSAEVMVDQGIVVYSDSRQDLFLVLDRGSLHWRKGDESFLIAEDVINLHTSKNRIWVKTRTEIAEVHTDTGAYVQLLSTENLDLPVSFADSRLVGLGDGGYYLSSGVGVSGIDQEGTIEGPYYMEGRRNQEILEPDWHKGAAFFQDNAWVLYVNLMRKNTVRIDPQQGILQDAVLSPDALAVVYALQRGRYTEIWYAGVTGEGAELVFSMEMIFSSLDLIWAPNMSMTAVTVLGYELDAGFNDNFHSTTFLYQPGRQGTAVLSKSQGSEVKALIPTAWDSGGDQVWFYWLHEEVQVPVCYSLFNQ